MPDIDGDMEWLRSGAERRLIDVVSATERSIMYSITQRSLPVKDSGRCRSAKHALSGAKCSGGEWVIGMSAIAEEDMSRYRRQSRICGKQNKR